MDQKNSDDLLQQLHDAINALDTVDEKGCELLEDLDKDIRQLLKRSGEQPYNIHPNFVQRLDRTIRHFEATYPDLADLLAKVMSSLSNAGV